MRLKKYAATAMVVLAISATAACGSDDSDTSPEASTPESSATSSAPMEADPAANLVGPGCADYAKAVPDGAGSVEGMAQDPVAVAASNNPLLKTLVSAVGVAGLGDTLNTAEAITVFAPTDDAFAKIPKKDLDAVLADKALLTKILTHHVVAGKLSPDQVAGARRQARYAPPRATSPPSWTSPRTPVARSSPPPNCSAARSCWSRPAT